MINHFRLFAVLAALPIVSGADIHVDCNSVDKGDGSSSSPYNSLSSVNSKDIGPGDKILFKSGTVCSGVLSPRGGGSSANPAHIASFGDGDLPIVNGQGADAAIILYNQDHWTISNIAVTNPADAIAARQGISITADDGKAHSGITIFNVTVYDVAGQTNKETRATDFGKSAGILIDSSSDNGGRLDDVAVHNTNVHDCGGGGIKLRLGQLDNQGERSRVWENTVESCGGDGVIVEYAKSPLIDHNQCNDLGGGKYPWTGGNFAGIWVLGCHNAVMQYNVVHDTHMSQFDSQAFDCDWGNTGNCTVEYNYGHDNAGGMFLNCDNCGTSGGATQIVRYNVFQNDCRIYSNGDKSALWFYNNVVYCPEQNLDLTFPKETYMWNNIIVGNGNSSLPTSGVDWKWNVFQNIEKPTNNGISGDPGFVAPGTGGDTRDSAKGYRLKDSSPALKNGAIISGNGGLDFWSNPVSDSSKPNRGAYNGPGL
ncbi:hypothetical protein PHISCL_05298 [Aspergillus sclerotialis]|uniref:Uncharacterized protein n=1 Tax=Aspergillus sclerotialis TaxID=2070753 RepID=A0A3A2ZH70_9EURO|nr:hypothetical protein PHISCL_05298 [Aspergillus sclerotialis]